MDSELIVRLRSCYDKVKAEENPAGGIKVSRKDNLAAEKLLSQGDQFFSKGFFIDAIDKYNESLCYAQADAENPFKLNEIYIKRAFALFRMDLPRECLESIRLAEDGPYPEYLRERLTKLTKRCQEKIKLLGDEPNNFCLKLSYPCHEKIPFMANCLELRTTEEQGRHIVTNRDLKVGDVVMIETPFVSCLFASQRYTRCANCMAGYQRHALLPCPSCADAMYCSEVCQTKAWDRFHRFECQISANLLMEDENLNLGLTLRAFFKGISTYGGLAEFQKYLQDHQDTALTVFDLDFHQRDEKLEFLTFHNLQSGDEHLPPTKKRIFTEKAAEWAILLSREGVIGEDITPDQVSFILETIYRYLVSVTINGFVNSTRLPPTYERDVVYTNQQLAMSLVNHSCAPNVQRFQQDNKQLVMVIRPIPKDSSLCYTYSRGYWGTPKEERAAYYMKQYGFECTCEACVEDYPMGGDLEEKIIEEEIDQEGAEDHHDKLQYLNRICDYLQKYHHLYPCAQLFEADAVLDYGFRTLLENDSWEQRDEFMRFRQVYETDQS